MMYPNYNNKQEKDYGCFFILIAIAAVCFFIWLIWAIVSSPEKAEPDPDSLATEMLEDSIKADGTDVGIFDVVDGDVVEESKTEKSDEERSSHRSGIGSQIHPLPHPLPGIDPERMKEFERIANTKVPEIKPLPKPTFVPHHNITPNDILKKSDNKADPEVESNINATVPVEIPASE